MDGWLFFLAGLALGSAPVWFYRRRLRVEAGWALLVYGGGDQPRVYFSSAWVRPVVERYELIDLTVKPLRLQCLGKEGVLCKDNIRVDVQAVLTLAIPRDARRVIQVAQTIGVERASDPKTLENLFQAKALEALRVSFKKWEFFELDEHIGEIVSNAVNIMGEDLGGYELVDLAIGSWEQTPLAQLDPNNILDAEGIRKITELTAVQQAVTRELRG